MSVINHNPDIGEQTITRRFEESLKNGGEKPAIDPKEPREWPGFRNILRRGLDLFRPKNPQSPVDPYPYLSGLDGLRPAEPKLRPQALTTPPVQSNTTEKRSPVMIPSGDIFPPFTANEDPEVRVRFERGRERLNHLKDAAVTLAKRVDGIQVRGLRLTDFAGGMALGSATRNATKVVLFGLTGVNPFLTLVAGGVAGAVTGGAREYANQIRENTKEAQLNSELEMPKGRFRIRDVKALAKATGIGALTGMAGAGVFTAASYIIENWGDLGSNFGHFAGEQLNNFQHLRDNHSFTAEPTHIFTPTETATPVPTETVIPTIPTPEAVVIATPSFELPATGITADLFPQDVPIESGSNLWQSIDVSQGWVNSANGVSQSDVIKNMIGLFAEDNGHNMTEIPSGIFSMDSLGLTPDQMAVIEEAAKTTSVEDYREQVMSHFLELLPKKYL